MATVAVMRFPSVEGANDALAVVRGLQTEHLIEVHDGAIASWPVGRESPWTRQLPNRVGMGAMNGMFWGMLFGLTFSARRCAPFRHRCWRRGRGVGSAFRDYGINENFVERVRSAVTEGTSALFLITSEAVMDRVVDAMRKKKFEIIASSLSKGQEQRWREALARE